LKADIDAQFGTSEPISIVAFSMGGLVSRHYLQQLGGAARCDKLITISSLTQQKESGVSTKGNNAARAGGTNKSRLKRGPAATNAARTSFKWFSEAA
ncbi:MAG: hypothetical protein WED15_06000, partial [Akkermansiaceae bacterium]